MSEHQESMGIEEAAARLQTTPKRLGAMAKSGAIPCVLKDGHLVFSKSAIEEFLVFTGPLGDPVDHPRASSDLPPIVALSFFSGAMGLDIGMRRGGIEALLASEIDKKSRRTINLNAPQMALIGDINSYEADEILKMARIPRERGVDVMFGGPPCQAFSTAGARRGLNDERGNVFLRYIDLASQIRPRYLVIENVRGLLSAAYPCGGSSRPVKGGAFHVILDRLKEAGYEVSFELYNAANFGAPQIRERMVLIGKLGGGKVAHLSPTHCNDPAWGLPAWRTLEDAFEGMDKSQCHHVDFPQKRLKFYRMLKEGQYWRDLPKEHLREAMGSKLEMSGGKTGFYRRLSMSKPSPTLVTNPAMPATDLCHPFEDRPLSVEEYAKIQEFPDDWKICGNILDKYRQIGNAVPIRLGEAIAKTIIADMAGGDKKGNGREFEGFRHSRYRMTSESSWREGMGKRLDKEMAASET